MDPISALACCGRSYGLQPELILCSSRRSRNPAVLSTPRTQPPAVKPGPVCGSENDEEEDRSQVQTPKRRKPRMMMTRVEAGETISPSSKSAFAYRPSVYRPELAERYRLEAGLVTALFQANEYIKEQNKSGRATAYTTAAMTTPRKSLGCNIIF